MEQVGSIDANTGDLLLGWDTDQFGTDYYLTTQMMYYILKHGGLGSGGVNFDAKVRRESFEPIDLFYAHVGGMDAFARGLKIAAAIRADGELSDVERHLSLQSHWTKIFAWTMMIVWWPSSCLRKEFSFLVK